MTTGPLTADEAAEFRAGTLDMDGDLYDRLFNYYLNSGEMPYGTAKARDGDPDQWIHQQLVRTYAQ